MVLYGLCINRLKVALRQVDRCLLESQDNSSKVVIEAYFMTESDDIRNYFGVRHQKQTIDQDLRDISKALTRHMKKKLTLEFIDDKGGLCLCYHPKGKIK